MNHIPLFKVFMSNEADEILLRTLHSGYVAQGPRVDEFENALARFWGMEENTVVTVNSGTTALDLAFELIGIHAGDYVISTPMTCVATNIMLAHRGARILWADVDPVTGLIDPSSVEEAIRKSPIKPKAIVVVDWAGEPCNFKDLRDVASDIPIVEDAAHAVGSYYAGKPVAVSGGDYVAWSFQAIKHLTTGDGGALKVPSDQLARAKRLRWFGYDRSGSEDFRSAQDLLELGFKYHMNDLAASIGLANLPHLDELLEKHGSNAVRMSASLIDAVPAESLPPESRDSSWWLYTIRTQRREELISHLKEKCIQSSPVHRRNDEYAAMKKHSVWLVRHHGTNDFASTELAIPIGWWLSSSDFERIVDAVKSFSW